MNAVEGSRTWPRWERRSKFPSRRAIKRALLTFMIASLIILTLWARGDYNRPGADHRYPSALHLASRAGNSRLVRFLLCIGARPDVVYDHGRTPLHELIRSCANEEQNGSCSDTLEALLAANAPLEATTTSRNVGVRQEEDNFSDAATPLEWACRLHRLSYARRLLEVGANPNRAIASAVTFGQTDIVHLLRNYGMDTSKHSQDTNHIASPHLYLSGR